MRERALVIFDEDVLDANILKALKARIVTQMLPPHRYDCILRVEESLIFDGRELLHGDRFRLEIPLSSITETSLGFDEVFVGKDSKGKNYQLRPIRVRYRAGDAVRTLYFFPEYKGLFRSSSSEEVYGILKSVVSV